MIRSRIRARTRVYGGVLSVVAVGFACAPLLMRRDDVNLTAQATPLQPSQVMRGAYLNTGSQDAGADPDWKDGKYIGRSNFNPSPSEVLEARARFEARLRQEKAARGGTLERA
jgi:hypothetical protein